MVIFIVVFIKEFRKYAKLRGKITNIIVIIGYSVIVDNKCKTSGSVLYFRSVVFITDFLSL